jgi:hypothetical protein
MFVRNCWYVIAWDHVRSRRVALPPRLSALHTNYLLICDNLLDFSHLIYAHWRKYRRVQRLIGFCDARPA